MNPLPPDPKVIVIAGGGRKVGKTTLARALANQLPGSVAVKLGEHAKKQSKSAFLLPLRTPFAAILKAVPEFSYLILESGSVLDDPDLRPDLVIFLPTGPNRTDKPGSERRRTRADVIRGQTGRGELYRLVRERLSTDNTKTEEIVRAIDSFDQGQVDPT